MIYNHRVWLSWNQQSSIHLLYLTLEAARQDLPLYFGFSWPLTILHFEGDQVYWFNRWEELRSLGLKMLDCLMVPGYQRFFYGEEFPRQSHNLEAAVRNVERLPLAALSDHDLLAAYSTFAHLYKSWYALGWYAEPVQFCAEALMEEELRFLRDSGRLDARTIADAKVHLYSSGEPTYSAEIEDSLLSCAAELLTALSDQGIAVEHPGGQLTAASRIAVSSSGNIETISMSVKDFCGKVVRSAPAFQGVTRLLAEHVDRYFWKRNNYYATIVLTFEDVLAECLGLIKGQTAPELLGRIGAATRRVEGAKALRMAVYSELRAYYKSVADILSRNSKMKDLRKRVMSLANHAIDSFLHEVARRAGYSIEDVRCLLPAELSECLESPKGTLKEEVCRRATSAVIFWGEQDTAPSAFTGNPALRSCGGFAEHAQPREWAMSDSIIVSGEAAGPFLSALNEKFFFILDWGEGRDLESISGECAFARAGEDEIRGVVRVVRDPKATSEFHPGEILVAPSTTPDYVPLIRSAKCLITDWGGWTSHAALCAREFNVPCIIGTYHASQVLCSGETVTIRIREGLVIRGRRRLE